MRLFSRSAGIIRKKSISAFIIDIYLVVLVSDFLDGVRAQNSSTPVYLEVPNPIGLYLAPLDAFTTAYVTQDQFQEVVKKKKETFKVTFFHQNVTWNEADVTCKVNDEYLLSILPNESELYSHLQKLGIEFLWTGIHRKANYYVQYQSNYLHLFKSSKEKTSKNIGEIWIDSEDFLYDCVVLSLNSGMLMTKNCSSLHPFVCESKKPFAAGKDGCPETWHLSPPLSQNGRICISQVIQPLPYDKAEKTCSQNQSRLASSKEYRILILRKQLHFKKDDQAFWAVNEDNNSCTYQYVQNMDNIQDPTCTKLPFDKLPFVCVKSMETESLEIIIEVGSTPNSVDSYQFIQWNSTCKTKNDKLICRAKDYSSKYLPFQWFRDGVPISNILYALQLSYLVGDYKWSKNNSNSYALQGSYHCELRLPGSVKTYRSETINLFYPDIATYIIDIHGIRHENYVDFSQSEFVEKMEKINSAINKILDEQKAIWDFKSIQKTGESYTMKLVLFKNRNNSYDDEEVYLDITKKFKENLPLLKLGDNVTLSVHSADVCFRSDLTPEEMCDEIKWPTTKHAKNVITERTCINDEKKFILRKCEGSTLSKAKWSSFNCSLCKEFLERYQDETIQCQNGYHRLNSQDICFKIYYEKKNWFDAHKTCSDFSSYLLDIPHGISIGNLSSSWLSFRFSYGKIQGFGQKPINFKALYEKEGILLKNTNMKSHDLYCVSTVTEKSRFTFKFSDCREEMPFVCIQKLYENVASSRFESNIKHLYKQNNVESCYYFESSLNSWEDATEFCERDLHGAKLLNGVQDIDSYRYLKKFIIDQYSSVNGCDVKTWWMDFEDVIQKGIPPNLSYVDWGPSTDFDLSFPHGVITLFPDKKIYWSLEEDHKKLGLICKVQKCFNNKSTLVYLEEQSLFETNGTEEAVTWLTSLKLICKPSGWYITDSFSWYRDNILIDDTSSREFSFNSFSIKSEKEALELQGHYSCSVDMVENKEIVYSSKHLIRLPGFYTFVVFMTTEEDNFLAECPSYILSTALYKTTALYQCFNEHWKDTLDLKEFHFHLKNITCFSSFINITVHLYFKNHAPEEDILEMLQKANFSNFQEACNIDLKSIIVKNTAYCYSEKVSLKNTDLKWPNTKLGESSFPEQMCLTNEGTLVQRTCMGDFNSGTFWSDISTTECKLVNSSITEELLNILRAGNIIDFLPRLQNLTSDPKLLKPADVQVVAQIFRSLAKQENSFPCDRLKEVVETVSNLIDLDKKVLSVASNSSNRVVDYLERITSSIDEKTCDKNISTKNVHFNLYSLNFNESVVPNSVLMSKSQTKSLFTASVKDLESNMQNFEAGLVIPESLLHKMSNIPNRVFYSFLENIYFQENISVVSVVISVSFSSGSVIDFGDEAISMLFKLRSKVELNQLPHLLCAFWNSDINSWSSDGCSKNISNNTIFCSCNHLTSFAVIMVRSPPDHHKSSLLYITYIGSSVSCIGLGTIILSFLFFREWRKSVKNKCLCNFSLSYLLFLTIYMAGIEKTNSGDWCKVIAVLLHYFLLSSFMWMIVLAYTVYLSLVKIFPTTIPCLIQKAMLFAWGVPVIIVGSILCAKYKHYFGKKFCWCSEDISTYAFEFPLILMLTINYLIFGTIFYMNIRGVYSISSNQDKRKLLIARAKALLCISILLGLSWIFRILAMRTTGDLQIVLIYLFTITTAFQGFLLALFFIFLPKVPRQLWIKFLTSPRSVFKYHSHVTSSSATNHGIH